MMKLDRNGNLSPHIGAFHLRLHDEAVVRAKLMREMVDAGLSYAEVGKRFKTSADAVRATLKRHGLYK